MTEPARTVSWPTVSLMAASFAAFVLALVPGLNDALLVGGLPTGTALLLAIVLLTFAAFLTAVLDTSLGPSARTLWAVAAALSGLIEIILLFVLVTLLYGT